MVGRLCNRKGNWVVFRSAGEILTCLQDESSVDPGSWTVEDVAVWLDGKEVRYSSFPMTRLVDVCLSVCLSV